MKTFLKVIGILLLSLLIGAVVGALPLLWLWYEMSTEQPGDATGDMIFFVLPIAAILFLVAAVGSALVMLLIFFIRLKRRR